MQQGQNPCYSKDMSRVTTKLQLTVPKKIADQYGIRPGDELEWIPAGDTIRVEVARTKTRNCSKLTVEERLAVFDDNTKWLDQVQADQLKKVKTNSTRITRQNRGWTREELYGDRGLPRRH